MVDNNTQFFKTQPEKTISVEGILEQVYLALKEKGYNPVNQIVGYIMSGDPTYITSHNNARSLIMKAERDELVEEVVRYFIEGKGYNMRIIGLDVGTKTVGVALSDPLGITAQPFETITRKENNKLRRTYARIEQIISEYDVTEIVVGYPKNMDDTIGERAKACEEFAAALERRTGLPVTLWDERLTTVEADEVLEECGMRRENRKTVIDQLAAVFILRGYMESKQK